MAGPYERRGTPRGPEYIKIKLAVGHKENDLL